MGRVVRQTILLLGLSISATVTIFLSIRTICTRARGAISTPLRVAPLCRLTVNLTIHLTRRGYVVIGALPLILAVSNALLIVSGLNSASHNEVITG